MSGSSRHCQWCDNTFSTNAVLSQHQKKAKYCLKLQGVNEPNKKYICVCDRVFTCNYTYKRHIECCLEYKNQQIVNKYNSIILNLQNKIKELKAELKLKDDKIMELAKTAISIPKTTTKTIQINNTINNLDPLLLENIKDYANQLTLDHHKKGAEGYGKFALEGPFKNKLACTDMTRGKFKYKDTVGDIRDDIGLAKIFTAFCDAFKKRSYDLAQEHLNELTKEFSAKQLELCPTVEWATSLARYKLDPTNPFCKDIIRFIKRGCKV